MKWICIRKYMLCIYHIPYYTILHIETLELTFTSTCNAGRDGRSIFSRGTSVVSNLSEVWLAIKVHRHSDTK
jgi:hypothetical protein